MSWRTACPDWADRIRSGRSLVPDLPLIETEAKRALDAFESLRLPDVPDKPKLEKSAGEWQRDLVKAIFGSYNPKTNERFIREFFCMVPKKSSKTTAGAAIMLVALLLNKRPRAEFLLIAPTLEIADLAFRQAVGMIEADEYLSKLMHVTEHRARITNRKSGAFLKVKSFDPRVVTGSKPSGVLLDELHVIAEASDADRVIGQLRGGLLPNPEAFLITITTQSERPPAGVFKSALMNARKVRDGELELPLLPMLYEFPQDVDWRDKANWWMVTPNNGKSITVDRLVPDYEAAVAAGQEELIRWASQHLNIEVGLALRSDAWAGAEFWSRCADSGLTLEALLARCDVVVVGIDGGGLDDMLGLTVLGRERDTGRWLVWSRAWAHKIVLDRRKEVASRLLDFERDGHLTIVDAPGDDVEAVADIVMQIEEFGLLAEKHAIAVDAAGIGDIVDALTARGIAVDRIIGIQQGWKLTGAIKTTERKLAGGEMAHDGSPLMAWCVGNAKVEPRGNAITITKQTAGSAKIDPVMSLFDAVSLMAMNPQAVVRANPEIIYL